MTSPVTMYHLVGGEFTRLGRDLPTDPPPPPPPPPPPATAERFPGDPNPRETGRFEWGCSIKGNGSPAAHELASGTKLAVRRRYYDQGNIAVSGTTSQRALILAVQEDHANNRLPWVSFKLPWAAAAAGDWDDELDALIAELESYPKPTALICGHEPENDGLPAADFRALQVRIRARIDAYRAAHPGDPRRISFGGCLMAFTWNRTSGRNPLDWYPGDGVWDWLAADHYTEPNQSIWRAQFQAFVDFCEDRDLPIAVGEWGLRAADTSGPSKMQGFYDRLLDGTHDCVMVSYFDSDLNSTEDGWRLTNTNGLLNKFRALMADGRTMHISDLGY